MMSFNFAPSNLPTTDDMLRIMGFAPAILQAEVSGIYGTELLRDLKRIIRYYEIYEHGAKFPPPPNPGNLNYIPAQLTYMRAANLIDKQARFVFGRSAEFIVGPEDPEDDSETTKTNISELQTLLDATLKENSFADKCLKGFKDACIGERVGITLDFNERGVFIKFHPSYSFVYDINEEEKLTKFIIFWTECDHLDKREQRIHKKKWELNEAGFCVITHDVLNGMGERIEADSEDPIITDFQFLPCTVVLNDGLTGDLDGESDIRRLAEYEAWYSKLANADLDGTQQNMNPILYTVDMTPESTAALPRGSGAFWDLASNKDVDESMTGKVGVLDTATNYSDPLSGALDRITTIMNETVDVPLINLENMTGVISSGKTLKAIYWPLSMRSDEKMQAWIPALEFVANTIITGCRLYPAAAAVYGVVPVPDTEYSLIVENPYSLPEDEAEEKALDMQEINNETMSRKRYIRKWRNLTDKEADQELDQILREKRMLEDSFGDLPGSTVPTVEEII